MKVTETVLYNGEAAIVTAINADGSVNLRVFHADGTDSAPAGVMLDAAAVVEPEQPAAPADAVVAAE